MRALRRRLRLWALRAVILFLAVYLLGVFRIPTLIPYVAVLIVVCADLVRTLRRGDGRGAGL